MTVLEHIIVTAKASPAVQRAELVLAELGEGWELFDVHIWNNKRQPEVSLLQTHDPFDWLEFQGVFTRFYRGSKGRTDPVIWDNADAAEIVKAVREAMK